MRKSSKTKYCTCHYKKLRGLRPAIFSERNGKDAIHQRGELVLLGQVRSSFSLFSNNKASSHFVKISESPSLTVTVFLARLGGNEY
jgi:hypothetical protein